MMRVIDYRELPSLAGAELPASSWHLIGQEQIDRFAGAVGDRQWIHVDVERARREIGGTIAHGFLTLSMLTPLSAETLDFTGVSRRINYGLERLRFTNPVKAGSRVRLTHRLAKVEPKAGGLALTRDCRIEIEDEPRPALTCEWIVLLIP
ncbi:MAG: MaoC family dehydratase [Rhodomicrobium sp.]